MSLQLGPQQAGAGLRARSSAAANRSGSPAGSVKSRNDRHPGSSYSRVSLGVPLETQRPPTARPLSAAILTDVFVVRSTGPTLAANQTIGGAGRTRESAYRSRFAAAKLEAEVLRASYGDATNVSALAGADVGQTHLDFASSPLPTVDVGDTIYNDDAAAGGFFSMGHDGEAEERQPLDRREQLRAEHEQSQLELMQLLDKMRDDPESSPFHYLSRFPIDDFPANPYHLKVVPHSAINEDSFFTVSSSGVTLFERGKAEFTQLDQWQREYYLFNEMLQIRCFKTYRFWKTWKVWKKYVRSIKVAHSTKTLEKHLFTLNDVFQKAILRVRTDGSAIADGEDKLKLFSLEPRTVYKLEHFVAAQESQAQTVMESLKEFHSKAHHSVTEACKATLAALQAKLYPPSEGTAHGSGTDLAAAAEADKSKFSYTVLAQQRAEHRKLQRFVRLTDYMITDIL
eukprot:SAG31_NODE_109_length_24587_cov_111.480848_5_plen_455_part_00